MSKIRRIQLIYAQFSLRPHATAHAHKQASSDSYIAIQVGRHAFLAFAAAQPGTIERERAGRILARFVAAGVLWIAGALVDDGLYAQAFELQTLR